MSIDLGTALAWPPALALLLGALLGAATRGRLRRLCWIAGPLLALWATTQVPEGVALSGSFLDYPLALLSGSGLRRLFASLFCLVALAGTLYGLDRARWYELCAAQLYAAAALGACFAGDLITLYLHWELMMVFATALIWCGGTEAARKAALRFALLQLLAGIVIKIGIEATMKHTGSGALEPLALDHYGAWLILAGTLAKAAAAPFSAWLADACAEAGPTGAVFLSACTTKVAILALLLLYPDLPLLFWLGLYLSAHGLVYAWRSALPQRALAYALVGQIGLMLLAIGSGAEGGPRAAAALAGAQLIYLPLLFMTAGLRRAPAGAAAGTGSTPILPGSLGAIMVALTLASLPLTAQFTGGPPLDSGIVIPLAGLLLLSAVALLRRLWPAPPGTSLPDFDWLWRVALFRPGAALLAFIVHSDQRARRQALNALDRLTNYARVWLAGGGRLSRSWSIGVTALWIVALLSGYVIIYYLA